MGTWGTGIFTDDFANDVKDELHDLLSQQTPIVEAVALLIAKHKEAALDPDEEIVFWLALAAAQWELGVLQPEIKTKALEIIDGGADLSFFDTAKLKKERKAVLENLRSQLLSPLPRQKIVPKRLGKTIDYEIGEVLSYQLESGDFSLFRVIGKHTDKGGQYPVVELLEWTGRVIPDIHEINKFPIKKENNKRGYSQFMVGALRKKIPDRLSRLGIKSAPAQKTGGYFIAPREFLDKLLNEIFGLF